MCYGGLWGTVFIMVSASIISIAIYFLVRKFGRKFVYDFCDEKKVEKIENSFDIYSENIQNTVE